MEKIFKKRLKRILVLFLTVLISMSSVQKIYAAETMEVEAESTLAVGETDSLAELPKEWAKFRNLYYYNRIPEKQKILYRRLDRVCARYLLSDRDITEDGELYDEEAYMEKVKTGELTLEQIRETVDLFTYDNPQYFF